MDSGPGTQRHPDAVDRSGDPRFGRGHRAGRHPRRSTQPVHLRCRPRGRQAVVELRTDADQPAGRLGEAVHQVHPTHRTLADAACRHDAHHRGRAYRRRRHQRRALGRTGRRRPGHRGDLRCADGRTGRTARARPGHPVQRALPGPLPVEAPGRRKTPGAEGTSVRRSHRRTGHQRRHSRTRRGSRTTRRTQPRRHRPHLLQARHRRADPIGDQDRRRGAHQARHRPRRGRPRRRPPLLGGPRRPAADDVFGDALAAQHHHLRRRRYRHTGAGRRVPHRALVAGPRLPTDAGGRNPGGHRRDGLPGGHHLAVGQAVAGRHRRYRTLGGSRKSPQRHGFRTQSAWRRHPRD